MGGCDTEGLKKAKSGEKNTQKSGGGYAFEIKTGMPGNPTNKGGINRPTKGQ